MIELFITSQLVHSTSRGKDGPSHHY